MQVRKEAGQGVTKQDLLTRAHPTKRLHLSPSWERVGVIECLKKNKRFQVSKRNGGHGETLQRSFRRMTGTQFQHFGSSCMASFGDAHCMSNSGQSLHAGRSRRGKKKPFSKEGTSRQAPAPSAWLKPAQRCTEGSHELTPMAQCPRL